MQTVLSPHARPGDLYERLSDGKVRCHACGHRCVIFDGKPGICQVRTNQHGTLFVPHGYVAALQLDPTEKKPFFHAYPGSLALSFGMMGCDFHCAYCQNWDISQAVRDPKAGQGGIRPLSAKKLVDLALREKARVLASTYNEPLITSEWAVDIFREAKTNGLTTAYISNGNGTPEVLRYIRPWVDLYKVDLKSFSDAHYRQLGGNLRKVMDTIRSLHELKFWLEIVTLVIPGFNDSDGELRDIARFLVDISPDIPWHVTAFHKDYRMTDTDNTSAQTLLRAAEIGRTEGLHFVYAGNRPGRVGEFENTFCPKCGELLIEREGFLIRQDLVTPKGRCPRCQTTVPGVWQEQVILK